MKHSLPKSRAHKNTARAFIKRFQDRLQKNKLLPARARILVAVSGGPDSMALLHALAKLQPRFNWKLAVAHVNYELRGNDSRKDQLLVEKVTKTLGIPVFALKKNSKAGTSEEKLRDIRYHFFDSLVQKHKFTHVALAHHQDDQAETFLIRLIRGSGSTGLSGMQEKRGVYARPFLRISKKEILDFITSAHIPFRHDKSNDETFYLRNKVRHELIPLLETYNPQIKKTLATTACILQEEASLLSKQKTNLRKTSSSLVKIIPKSWERLSVSEQKKEIRALFQDRGLRLPTRNLVETLQKDLSSSLKRGSVREYSRLRVERKNDTIHIHFKERE